MALDENDINMTLNEFADDNEIPEEQIEEPINRRLIIQPHDRAISDVVRMIEDGDIDLTPPYQRNYLWDNKNEKITSKLIESILLNVPIPVVYLAEEEDGTYSVIDGLQRLTTLKRFYKDEFALSGLETLPEFNKKKYKDLDSKYQRIFKNGIIRTMLILKDSNPDIKFDIFERLNSGSVSLNEQEMRNGLYHGFFNDLIMDLRKNANLQHCLNLSNDLKGKDGLHNRYLDAEIILRFITMIYKESAIETDYKQRMKVFLNIFMRENRNPSESLLTSFKEIFEKTIKNIDIVFGENAFRKYETEKKQFEKIINRSVVDCFATSFSKLDTSTVEDRKEDIFNAYIELSAEKDFIDSITKWTSTRTNLLTRIKMWNDKLQEINVL